MSLRQTLFRTGFAIATVVLVVAGSASLGHALGDCACGCGPTTPCPCAADGVCRPKRDSWGHYKTKWRAWPGEPSGKAPTLAEQEGAGEPEVTPLPEYETPPAEQEDLRMPKKKKKDRPEDSEDAATEEMPMEIPGQLLPGPGVAPEGDALPDLDPFSGVPNVPAMEDAPPTLPKSLRQAAVSMGMPRLTLQPLPVQSESIQPNQMQPMPTQIVPASAEMPVEQANWQTGAAAQLANPAVATAVEPANVPLQPAVYYEASDEGK